MVKVDQKIDTLLLALKAFNRSVTLFDQYEKAFLANSTEVNAELFIAMRDSMIQRFEYCTDLFWKVLKIYMESIEKLDVELASPRGIVRDAVKAKIISEAEGAICMDMVVNRNKTSHIYHQEMAEIIAAQVPEFYQLMEKIVERLGKRLSSK